MTDYPVIQPDHEAHSNLQWSVVSYVKTLGISIKVDWFAGDLHLNFYGTRGKAVVPLDMYNDYEGDMSQFAQWCRDNPDELVGLEVNKSGGDTWDL